MEKIQIQELCPLLQEKTSLTVEELEQFVTAMFSIIQDGLNRDGMVKVKGLGTFKIVTVDARESISVNTGERFVIDEHDKITFTPDSAMKELVNRPFSQFDTVVLNDGVTFDDATLDEEVAKLQMADSAEKPTPLPVAEPEEQPAEEPTLEPVAEPEEQPAEEPMPEPVAEPGEQLTSELEEQPTVEAAVKPVAEQEQKHTRAEYKWTQEEDVQPEDEEERSTVWKWVLAIALLAILCGAAYYFYTKQFAPKPPVEILTTEEVVKQPAKQDTAAVSHTDSLKKEEVKTDSTTKMTETPKDTVVATAGLSAAEKARIKKDAEMYERADSRLRAGAYYIVGFDYEVSVRQGDDLQKIARRTVGEPLVCYLSVYNSIHDTATLKPGQKVLIPKLIMKKKLNN